MKRPRKMGTFGRFAHAGGGTMIGGGKYASDDHYEDRKTGESITVVCTTDRHFDMPRRVRGPAQLRKLSGVKPGSVKVSFYR